MCTDDGSYGRPGFVTQALADVLAAGGVNAVYAVGPVPMMRAVADLTRPYGVHTVVSLNPIMVDGTGMRLGLSRQRGWRDQVRVRRWAGVRRPRRRLRRVADRLSTYKDFERQAFENRRCSAAVGAAT